MMIFHVAITEVELADLLTALMAARKDGDRRAGELFRKFAVLEPWADGDPRDRRQKETAL